MKKYRLAIFSCLLFSGILQAGTPKGLQELREVDIPKLSYEGRFLQAFSWQDSMGSNIYLLSASSIFELDSMKAKQVGCYRACMGKWLYSYHFIKKDTGYTFLWKMKDGIEGCDGELRAEFNVRSASVTDLDDNNLAETWYTFQTGCGKASQHNPNVYKLILHEGMNKYAYRGTTTVVYADDKKKEGIFTRDNTWSSLPAAFNEMADSLWKEYLLQDVRSPLEEKSTVAKTVQPFPGMTDKQRTELLSLGIKIPAPTWLPGGMFLDKATSEITTGKKTGKDFIRLFYRGNGKSLVIQAAFDGLGSLIFDGEPGTLKTPLAEYSYYYEPKEEGEARPGYAATNWFVIEDKEDAPSWEVKSGTAVDEKYSALTRDEFVKVLQLLKVLK